MVEWSKRRHDHLNFHMTKILSGHGCFNSYLRRINKADTDVCSHCYMSVDDAQHTLELCPSWNIHREELKRVIGEDLSLPEVIGKIVESPDAWRVFAIFCNKVLVTKESAEREKQRAAAAIREIADADLENSKDSLL